MNGAAISQLKNETTNDELTELLSDLTVDETSLVVELIKKAKYDKDGRVRIDPVSVVREFLKAEQTPGGLKYDIPSPMPEMIKSYPQSIEIPLSDESPSDVVSNLLHSRRSVRDFKRKPLSIEQLSHILKGAYGVKKSVRAYDQKSFPTRVVPSSGGLQPVETYVIVNDIEGLDQGVYHFNPLKNVLVLLDAGLMRRKMVRNCVYQDWIGEVPALIGLTCDLNKLYWKYEKRAYKMCHIDVGVVAQTMHLLIHSMNLGSCMLAGFDEDGINAILNLDGKKEFVALLIALGCPIK